MPAIRSLCACVFFVFAVLAFTTSNASALAPGPHYTERENTIFIRNDWGGLILNYLDLFGRISRDGLNVVVDGACYSACSLVLGAIPHEKICVTKRAIFGFHAPYMLDKGKKVYDELATHEMLSLYPHPVRVWITSRGGLKEKMIFLRGAKLQEIYPVCTR